MPTLLAEVELYDDDEVDVDDLAGRLEDFAGDVAGGVEAYADTLGQTAEALDPADLLNSESATNIVHYFLVQQYAEDDWHAELALEGEDFKPQRNDDGEDGEDDDHDDDLTDVAEQWCDSWATAVDSVIVGTVETLADLEQYDGWDELLGPYRAIYEATPDKAVLTYGREGNTLQVFVKRPSWRAKIYWCWLRKQLPMFRVGLYWWRKTEEHLWHPQGRDGKRAREAYDRGDILPDAKRVQKA